MSPQPARPLEPTDTMLAVRERLRLLFEEFGLGEAWNKVETATDDAGKTGEDDGGIPSRP